MRYHIGATAVGDERLRDQPRLVQFVVEGDEPRHLGGEFTEQQLRERIERMEARNERVPREYQDALEQLESGG